MPSRPRSSPTLQPNRPKHNPTGALRRASVDFMRIFLLALLLVGCVSNAPKYVAVCPDCGQTNRLSGTLLYPGSRSCTNGFLRERTVAFKCPCCKTPFTRPLPPVFVPDIPAVPVK
jgi:hypothetical protein